jgi:gamma-glutamyltranspeptidase/glutathione hydrolase
MRLILTLFAVCFLAIGPAGAQPAESGFGRGERVSGAPFSGRSAVIAPNGAAASAHPLATQIAIDVLKAGGSAVDAAIAANAMLGLVEPTGCGIGGDLYAIVWDPKTQKLYGYNGSGRSPRGQSLAQVRAIAAKQGRALIPSFGVVSVSVPGAVDGWFALHGRFGRTSMARLLAPSISYARAGAPIPDAIAYYWERNRLRLEREASEGRLEDIANARALYWPDGVSPPAGSLFRNLDLARTYEALAGGGRRAFYDGEIAARIDGYMRRIGGALRRGDLAAHRGEWVEVFCGAYRAGVELCELGGNTQGVTAIQILQMLQRFDLRAMGFLSADSLHAQIEAKRLAFADRALAFHDPAFSRIDQRRLIEPAYAAERSALISMARAMDNPGPGAWLEASGDTTYLTTADKDGMMVSLIQSNYRGMGSGLVADGTGFMLQNRGELFALADGHPNQYAPGKRPFQTIIPGFAMKDGAPWLAFGVMGGDMQPQGHAQIIINMVDYGLDLQAAGDAARWRHGGSAEPTGEAAEGRGQVFLENGVPAAVRAELARRGHDVRTADGSFGGYQAIMRDRARGVYVAASEMRKDGQAAGY